MKTIENQTFDKERDYHCGFGNDGALPCGGQYSPPR